MINLYLIRHGECAGSGLYIGRGSDTSLTTNGIKQIYSLEKHLTQLKDNISMLISSPMKRCLESSDIISNIVNCEITKFSGIEELDFGDWEGLSYDDLQHLEIYKDWIENPIECSPPNGENLKDLKIRVLNIVKEIKKYILEEEEKNIIIVGHRGSLIILLLYFLKLDIKYFWNFVIDRGSISKLRLYPDFFSLDYLNFNGEE